MIKDNQKRLNRVHVLLDALITILAYALAWFVVISGKVMDTPGGTLPPQIYFAALIFVVPAYLILYASFHLYTPKRIQGRRSEFANICKANVIGLMLFTFVLFGARSFMAHNEYFSTRMLLAFSGTNTLLLETERMAFRLFLHSLRTNGYNQKHILLIGWSRAAEGFIDRVIVNPEWGYHIQGILDDHKPEGFAYKNVRVLGPHQPSGNVPGCQYAGRDRDHSEHYGVCQSGTDRGGLREVRRSNTKFIPDYNHMIPTIPYMEDLQGLPVIHIRHVPLTGVFNATMKRCVDIVGALFGLLIFSPVMLLTAVLIKLTSPGPVIFSQERIGLHNRPFKMYKFRSMEVQDPGKEKSQWTTPHDPRVTPIGRFIRKTSIDETPQFFNVLIGDMSLVGPRPERPLVCGKIQRGNSAVHDQASGSPGTDGLGPGQRLSGRYLHHQTDRARSVLY